MPSIDYYGLNDSDRIISFIRNDKLNDPSKIHFIAGKHHQSVWLEPSYEIPFHVYTHRDTNIEDIASSLNAVTGLEIPDNFFYGTSIYNIDAMLYHLGQKVQFRVLRQQIFLSGSIDPITEEDTHKILYHAIGNALWNFLDFSLWRTQDDKKEEYRELRGIPFAYPSNRWDHQHSIFHIASEDFRYLFGPATAGRGEWYLNFKSSDGQRIDPPSPNIIEFWQRELERYGNRNEEKGSDLST